MASPAAPTPFCPRCGGPAVWHAQVGQWGCDRCRQMLPAPASPPAPQPAAAPWPAPPGAPPQAQAWPQPGQPPQAQAWPQPGQPLQAQAWPQPGQPPQAQAWPQPGQPPQPQAWPQPGQPPPMAPTCPRCASVGVWYPQAGIWGCERCRAPIGAPVPRAATPPPTNVGLAVMKVFGVILLIIVAIVIKVWAKGGFR